MSIEKWTVRRTRITPQLIAGSALTDGPGTTLLSGRNYYWAGTPPTGEEGSLLARRHRPQRVNLHSTARIRSPTRRQKAREEGQRRSRLISQIGTAPGARWPMDMSSTPHHDARRLSRRHLAAAVAGAIESCVTARGQDRGQTGRVLSSNSGGVGPRAALDPKVDPRLLQLFVDGIEQPIKVIGEQDGRL